MKYAIKNQLKQAEMQGNELQIVSRETGSRKMTKQFEKKHLKQFKNQSQSGRSMVEMLGVLAIIAVLSIGGIVGYRLAMNHYQASQIAHEMNIMRTDAQIKIAQGTEKLTLGAPYDAHKINFNNYDTAFGCKYVNEDDFISEETVSCQIANAYYIELPKIPDGVCQPLTRLINGIDNLIAFSVNDSEYEEGGTCQEGENDLYAVFSGETVSDLTHCERDDDCDELESTPVCDLSRHVCVECTEEKGCEGESEYCENNVCKSCDEGLVWNGTDCVECTADGDCTDTPDTPVCNTETNTCVECLNNQNCIEKDTNNPVCNSDTNTCEPCPPKSIFYEGECHTYECRTNEDCADKGSDYYCYLYEGYQWDSEWENKPGTYFSGSCHKAETDKISGGITHYVKSKDIMTWWSAQRFCKALNMTPVSSSDISCEDVNELASCTSSMVANLRDDFPIVGTYGLWLEPIDDPMNEFYRAVRSIFLDNGAIDPDNRANGDGTPNYGFCH